MDEPITLTLVGHNTARVELPEALRGIDGNRHGLLDDGSGELGVALLDVSEAGDSGHRRDLLARAARRVAVPIAGDVGVGRLGANACKHRHTNNNDVRAAER